MQRTLIFGLLVSSCAFAQSEGNHVFVTAGAFGFQQKMSGTPVQGAPYSATITNESVQTLADGNRIVQTSTGTTARDSLGRTRQDAPLPMIGNMRPADAPHMVIIQDPVAQTSYTLNMADKTAFKTPNVTQVSSLGASGAATVGVRSGTFFSSAGPQSQAAPPSPPHAPLQTMMMQKVMIAGDEGDAQTEDLGPKTMEGVMVTGTRTTVTIPAGKIGNDRALSVVTEVWTSPDLKTVVYSKRSDPRMGDQTFQLTNIVRAEPDPALFTVPADFKIMDAGEPIVYERSAPPSTQSQP
ncbi:MAG: hypothetical protein JOZ32_11325 [Bryobacterales bacterium]|nr:hypothetical protein [Bryobacterales bacterium]